MILSSNSGGQDPLRRFMSLCSGGWGNGKTAFPKPVNKKTRNRALFLARHLVPFMKILPLPRFSDSILSKHPFAYNMRKTGISAIGNGATPFTARKKRTAQAP
jgi:hypothetical protein